MQGAAQIEVDELANQLIKENDQEKIKTLQNDIVARQLAMAWIRDTIILGEEAIGQLRGEE